MTFDPQDHYFKKAKKENFLARSIYKLEEIDKKFKVLTKGNYVLDLGYYPGSWIQYTSNLIGPQGQVVGIDLQVVNPKLQNLKNTMLFQDNIFEFDFSKLPNQKKFDCILSDMAPNTTGIKDVDQARSLDLVEKVFELKNSLLRPGGNIVVKVFDSNDAQIRLKQEKIHFERFSSLKPKSTRSISKEFFVIGLGFKA